MGKRIYLICFLGLGFWGLTACVNPGTTNKPDEGPSPAKTPAEELITFQLEPGLKIQLVASEPMVQDPVVIAFDADGRLWTVEMRGFMPTIDGTGEKEKIGRVSILQDTNGDGHMDRSTVYLDSLIMPRALTFVPGGALVAENGSLWLTQDLNNDLKADTKTLIDSTYAGSPLPEHSGNGLWRDSDNWYYNAKSRLRYRLENGKWLRDSTEFRGQWGISQDDEGRLYYNYNWSQLHADLVPPNYLSRNKNHKPTTGIDHGLTVDRRIYPIRPNPAVNRGYIPGTLDKEGRLLEFTAACSPHVYRGTALPKEYYSNVFVCEPSGNLIKRNVVEENGITLSAHDPHPGKEFLASTDERFRPVHLTTGPDGALYIADMYRGLVQHGAYITPYLKEQTLSRKLVQPIHRGRIWRIVPEKGSLSKTPQLSTATTLELVTYLSHPNGWYRDMAQRLLVERNDPGAESALMALATKGENDLGRFHALWTLSGLKKENPNLLLSLVADQNPLIRTTALRLLEPIAQKNKTVQEQLGKKLLQEWENAPMEQILQIALSASSLDQKVAHTLLAGIVEKYGSSALIRDAVLSSLPNQEFAFLQKLWQVPAWQTAEPAKEIFLEMLATAIIKKRDSGELAELLTLLNKNNKALSWRTNAVLTGLSMSGSNAKTPPIQLTSAPAIFTKSSREIDPTRLATLIKLFQWPGHTVPAANENATKTNLLNEEQQQLFALGRQHFLTTCAGCHGTNGAGLNRFAPPLVGSDWVLGDEKRLALIVLHGMEGPVEVTGKVYDAPEILPVMPAHSTMDDASITAILTYIRNEWGNNAGPVGKRTVGATRLTSQGRVVPWKSEELKKYVLETKAAEAK
ncbi:dehydrogenase [Adhaeribacter arboris]|uniref:Dehydrogenase n=1 Tax=Adhaeribacter arboris TaxID=2072846 RepID=A0A2T2YNZ0_9BACT|nr:c-type cytochrome [Adhaeribacter arboris]PSR57234.1 dehydrogenase [Adhaeribacter arboris]